MDIVIFIGPMTYSIPPYEVKEDTVYMGVEQGAYQALKKGYPLDLAIGDFDSIEQDMYPYIKQHAKHIKHVQSEKNDTDSALVIKEALALNPENITVYGGIGGRFDHTYANLLWLKKGSITFLTDNHMMTVLKPGTHDIKHAFKYVSFFALKRVQSLTLKDFKFELENYDLDVDDPLCVSNEGSGSLSFEKGLLLVVANDDIA